MSSDTAGRATDRDAEGERELALLAAMRLAVGTCVPRSPAAPPDDLDEGSADS